MTDELIGRPMRFEIFARRNRLMQRRWYFRIKAGNGKIIAQSEGYRNRVDAVSTVDSIIERAAHAMVVQP